MSIRITTLGAVQVVRGDSVLSGLPAQRLRCALLVFLAVNRQATRDRLLAMFWSERSEDRARHALSQTVYELRRTLGDEWIEVRGEQLIVAPHVTIDVPAFEEAVDRGDHTMALSLYRGAFLDGFYLDAPGWQAWVDGVRIRCERQHRRARRESVTRLLDQARLREALTVARDWVTLDPFDDEAQHRLIELLATMGDRAGAVGQFEAYEKLLVAEDLTPLDETRALVERIRAGEIGALPTATAIDASGPRPAPITASRPSPAPAALASGSIEPPQAGQVTVGPIRARLHRAGWRTFGIVAAIAAVLAVLVGVRAFRNDPPQPVTAAAAPHRVAVLYFDDNSPPPGASHLAASLTETLIDEFSRLNPLLLTVRSRHAVAGFRTNGVTLDSIGRALAVDAIIDGTVIVADGQVRVTVQLIDPFTGDVLTSDVVQRPDGQYLRLVDDVIGTVVTLLRRQLGRELEMRRSRGATRSDAAWLAFSRGAEAFEEAVRLGHRITPEELRLLLNRADSLLLLAEQADRAWPDPTIMRGWVAEKQGYAALAMGRQKRAGEWFDSAAHHAERVLSRDPRSARAYELRGTARIRYATWSTSEPGQLGEVRRQGMADLQEATRLDPTRAPAYAALAGVLIAHGRYEEAGNAARRAEQLDPFQRSASEINYNIAMSDFELRRDSAALARCLDGVQRFGDGRSAYCALSVLAWSDVRPVPPDSLWTIARSAHGRVDHRTQTMMDMLVAGGLIRAGEPDSARDVLERAAKRPASDAAMWIEPAVRVRLGDTETAITMLRSYLARPQLDEYHRILETRAMQPFVRNPALIRALEGGS